MGNRRKWLRHGFWIAAWTLCAGVTFADRLPMPIIGWLWLGAVLGDLCRDLGEALADRMRRCG